MYKRRILSFKSKLSLAMLVFMLVFVVVSSFRTPPPTVPPPATRPNIVILLADDLGFADVSINSNQGIKTPNLERLTAGGTRFTQGYVTSPVCSPSRAGLLTGRYQQRFGFEYNTGPAKRDMEMGLGLPEGQLTIANHLKKSGYATGIIGKWHEGSNEPFFPTKRGFDSFFGFLPGASLYIDPATEGVVSVKTEGEGTLLQKRGPYNTIYRNQEKVDENEYLTEAFAREANAFIERHQKEPFLLYVPFNAPHTPLQATRKYLDRHANIQDSTRRVYAAMISALDDAVGSILNTLKEKGLEENTLVFFLSDNGCAMYTGACSPTQLNGGKLTHYENGIRVPFVVRYPRKIPAGKAYDKPVSSLDILPTALAVAGAKLPDATQLDGVNLLPYLSGKAKNAPHEYLFWRNDPNIAVRHENWKLWKSKKGSFTLLFDLSKDEGERENVAEKYPEKVKELEKALNNWDKQLKTPLWPTRGEVKFTFMDIEFELPV